MASITFDTLKFVEKLKAGGIPEEQAKATSEAFRDASGDADLATRRGIRELELRMEKGFEQIRGELTLIRWMLGILLGGIIALIIKALFPL
jgi:hypothetical protein